MEEKRKKKEKKLKMELLSTHSPKSSFDQL